MASLTVMCLCVHRWSFYRFKMHHVWNSLPKKKICPLQVTCCWSLGCCVVSDQPGGETRGADPGAGISAEAAGKLTAEAQHAAAQQRHAVPAAPCWPRHSQWVAGEFCHCLQRGLLIFCPLKRLHLDETQGGRRQKEQNHVDDVSLIAIRRRWKFHLHSTVDFVDVAQMNKSEYKLFSKKTEKGGLLDCLFSFLWNVYAISLWIRRLSGMLSETTWIRCIFA